MVFLLDAVFDWVLENVKVCLVGRGFGDNFDFLGWCDFVSVWTVEEGQ